MCGNPSWAFVSFGEAGCTMPHADDEGKAGYPQLPKRSAGVPCRTTHLDPKDLFSQRSLPFAGRGHAHDWVTEWHESGLNEPEMKLTLASEWLRKDKLYLNWLKPCQYKVKPSNIFLTRSEPIELNCIRWASHRMWDSTRTHKNELSCRIAAP